MKNKWKSGLLIGMLMLLCVPGLFASELTPAQPAHVEPVGTSARKLQRGFLNVALAPLEFSKHLWSADDVWLIPSWVVGSAKGIGRTTGRALVGVYEMATFWLPLPANYEPLVKPEFAWEHLDSE